MRKEQRVLERRRLIFHLEVVNRDTGRTLGRLVDITEEGLMLMLPAAVEVGQVYPCRMLLPEDRQLEFDAKAKWVKPGVNPDYYDAGFGFSGISAQDEQAITDLIEQYRMS